MKANLKIKEKTILFLILLFPIIILTFGIIPIIGSDPHTFSSNLPKLSSSPISINTPEDINYDQPMAGYYPATFGFEDEIDGTSGMSIGFVDEYDTSQGEYADIIGEIGGHKKVLRLYDRDPNAGQATKVKNDINNIVSGTVEW